MKDVFYRGLDYWNKSLSDSITLLMSVVNFIEEQRGDGATSIKQLSDDHLEVANKALGMRDHRRQPQQLPVRHHPHLPTLTHPGMDS